MVKEGSWWRRRKDEVEVERRGEHQRNSRLGGCGTMNIKKGSVREEKLLNGREG